MDIKLIVFDLDGTLTSSHKTIYKSTFYALEKLNIQHNLTENKFYEMIGMHFEDIFDQFGFKVNDFNKFIEIYKSAYFTFIDSTFLYEGVRETLEKLKKNNFRIALLTTKAQDQAEMNVDYFDLTKFFHYIMGRRKGIEHKPSPEPLLKICADLKININNTIIVGDTEMDIQCGKNSGAYTCGVTYGYRTKHELIKHFPDFLIDSITELPNIISGNNQL